MMNQLDLEFPENPSPPPRPKLRDEHVCRLAAKNAFQEIQKNWWDDADGPMGEEDYKAIAEVVQENDGYRAARRLERYYFWAPDALLVDILDKAWLHMALYQAIRDWVRHNAITPKFKIGDAVRCQHGRGTITEIRADTAQYVVTIGSRYTVDAGSVSGAGADTAGSD